AVRCSTLPQGTRATGMKFWVGHKQLRRRNRPRPPVHSLNLAIHRTTTLGAVVSVAAHLEAAALGGAAVEDLGAGEWEAEAVHALPMYRRTRPLLLPEVLAR